MTIPYVLRITGTCAAEDATEITLRADAPTFDPGSVSLDSKKFGFWTGRHIQGRITDNPQNSRITVSIGGWETLCGYWGGFWEDVISVWMFVCTAKSADMQVPAEATPTEMVGKKHPGRPISLDKRMIADICRGNLSSPTDQFYKATTLSVSDVASKIAQLQARNPAAPIALANRDIAAALRLLGGAVRCVWLL